MNTQSHILIACAIFAKAPGKQHRRRNWAVFLGALAPDVLLFLMYGWAKFTNTPEYEIWTQWYYSPPWQTWIDASNSFLLYFVLIGLVIAMGIFAKIKAPKNIWTHALTLFSLAAILHLVCDLPLHVDDGHAHFWPLSHWRFASPVSYWDSAHYGNYFGLFETLLGVFLSVILWRRFSALWLKALLILCILSYIGLPLFFMF